MFRKQVQSQREGRGDYENLLYLKGGRHEKNILKEWGAMKNLPRVQKYLPTHPTPGINNEGYKFISAFALLRTTLLK